MPSGFPEQVYSLIERNSNSILLHSSRSDSENVRSLLFLHPEEVLVANHTDEIATLFHDVELLLSAGKYVAGYLSYECGEHFEQISKERHDTTTPVAWFGVYSAPSVYDHASKDFLGEAPRALSNASESQSAFSVSNLHIGIDRDVYRSKLQVIQELIRAGETYQINLTDKFSFDFSGSPGALFSALNVSQPVPYAAFIHHDDRFILSLSPELFFRVKDGKIVTRPMKGTAPRGRTSQEDREVAKWLGNDPKNRAENVMIVDLLRNDLGRLCEYGSVRVDNLFSVEKYDTLLQMTSTISGTLRAGVRPYDIFGAIFPCGSITGAPKIRSMQIISHLESEPRGVYTGAIGYFSPSGDSAFSVAIRTITLDGNRGQMGVGGGITIDSVAEEEFRECELKARFLANPTPQFRIFESLLWNGDYPHLDRHLNRLGDSAAYFDVNFDRARAEERLRENARSLSPMTDYKVRLMLGRDGEVTISNSIVQPGPAELVVTISSIRTSSTDRFLFHKTTNRKLYDDEYDRASRNGFADVIFLNERDEITEGAISNILIKVGTKLVTPPLSCGVLPGVFRQHLLETDTAVFEKVLTRNDLVVADAIYICNAVRGMRRVKLETSVSTSA